MKLLKNKTTKNLIIILALTAILSGLLPNYVHAALDTENGGGILEPIEQFVVYLCDNVMQWLQDRFISTEKIEQDNGDYKYNFQYSPAIIFSGKVPALDINFVSQKKEYEAEEITEKVEVKTDLSRISIDLDEYKKMYSKKYPSVENMINDIYNLGRIEKNDGGYIAIKDRYQAAERF